MKRLTQEQVRQVYAARGKTPARKLAGILEIDQYLIYKIWASPVYLGVKRPKLPRNYKQYRARGEEASGHKLTEEQVIRIREMIADNMMSKKAMGQKFGVSIPAIVSIDKKKSWRHLK